MILIDLPADSTSFWEILGALATAAAAIIALGLGLAGATSRWHRRYKNAFSAARLIRVTGPGISQQDYEQRFEIRGFNYGSRPVLQLYPAIWLTQVGDSPPAKPADESAYAPEESWDRIFSKPWLANEAMPVHRQEFGDDHYCIAWRVVWRDLDGYAWAVDGYDPREPYLFRGQPPRLNQPADANMPDYRPPAYKLTDGARVRQAVQRVMRRRPY